MVVARMRLPGREQVLDLLLIHVFRFAVVFRVRASRWLAALHDFVPRMPPESEDCREGCSFEDRVRMMYICVYVRTAYIRVQIYVHTFTYAYIYIYIYIYICVYIYIYIYTYIYIYIYICICDTHV